MINVAVDSVKGVLPLINYKIYLGVLLRSMNNPLMLIWIIRTLKNILKLSITMS